MTGWMQAAGWGGLAGSALLLGAAIGWWVPIGARAVAAVTAFGSGVLISALSFELMEEAHARGGLLSSGLGCFAGAAAYTLANAWLARRGARHRKRSGSQLRDDAASAGGGMAIAIGALLDGVPESMVIGLGLLQGGAVGTVMMAAVFLSNVPEGLSSAIGMKRAGRGASYVFGIWAAIALASAAAAALGFVLFDAASPHAVALTTAFAAGAVLAMLVDTMIPEAYSVAHDAAGLITVAGFLVGFALSKGVGA
jgi:zinc transporter, ZIP family